MDDLREQLAALAHEQWSNWMTYMFSLSDINKYGQATIPAALVQRWKRQMETPYAELSEKEKESDREEADRVLRVLTEVDEQLEGWTCRAGFAPDVGR